MAGSSLSLGAIIGIAVAGTFVLAVTAGISLAWVARHRRQQRRRLRIRQEQETHQKQVIAIMMTGQSNGTKTAAGRPMSVSTATAAAAVAAGYFGPPDMLSECSGSSTCCSLASSPSYSSLDSSFEGSGAAWWCRWHWRRFCRRHRHWWRLKKSQNPWLFGRDGEAASAGVKTQGSDLEGQKQPSLPRKPANCHHNHRPGHHHHRPVEPGKPNKLRKEHPNAAACVLSVDEAAKVKAGKAAAALEAAAAISVTSATPEGRFIPPYPSAAGSLTGSFRAPSMSSSTVSLLAPQRPPRPQQPAEALTRPSSRDGPLQVPPIRSMRTGQPIQPNRNQQMQHQHQRQYSHYDDNNALQNCPPGLLATRQGMPPQAAPPRPVHPSQMSRQGNQHPPQLPNSTLQQQRQYQDEQYRQQQQYEYELQMYQQRQYQLQQYQQYQYQQQQFMQRQRSYRSYNKMPKSPSTDSALSEILKSTERRLQLLQATQTQSTLVGTMATLPEAAPGNDLTTRDVANAHTSVDAAAASCVFAATSEDEKRVSQQSTVSDADSIFVTERIDTSSTAATAVSESMATGLSSPSRSPKKSHASPAQIPGQTRVSINGSTVSGLTPPPPVMGPTLQASPGHGPAVSPANTIVLVPSVVSGPPPDVSPSLYDSTSQRSSLSTLYSEDERPESSSTAATSGLVYMHSNTNSVSDRVATPDKAIVVTRDVEVAHQDDDDMAEAIMTGLGITDDMCSTHANDVNDAGEKLPDDASMVPEALSTPRTRALSLGFGMGFGAGTGLGLSPRSPDTGKKSSGRLSGSANGILGRMLPRNSNSSNGGSPAKGTRNSSRGSAPPPAQAKAGKDNGIRFSFGVAHLPGSDAREASTPSKATTASTALPQVMVTSPSTNSLRPVVSGPPIRCSSGPDLSGKMGLLGLISKDDKDVFTSPPEVARTPAVTALMQSSAADWSVQSSPTLGPEDLSPSKRSATDTPPRLQLEETVAIKSADNDDDETPKVSRMGGRRTRARGHSMTQNKRGSSGSSSGGSTDVRPLPTPPMRHMSTKTAQAQAQAMADMASATTMMAMASTLRRMNSVAYSEASSCPSGTSTVGTSPTLGASGPPFGPTAAAYPVYSSAGRRQGKKRNSSGDCGGRPGGRPAGGGGHGNTGGLGSRDSVGSRQYLALGKRRSSGNGSGNGSRHGSGNNSPAASSNRNSGNLSGSDKENPENNKDEARVSSASNNNNTGSVHQSTSNGGGRRSSGNSPSSFAGPAPSSRPRTFSSTGTTLRCVQEDPATSSKVTASPKRPSGKRLSSGSAVKMSPNKASRSSPAGRSQARASTRSSVGGKLNNRGSLGLYDRDGFLIPSPERARKEKK